MPQYQAEIKDKNFTLAKEEARHLKVARAHAGDEIKIFDGHGKKFLAKLNELSDKSAAGVILQELPFTKPSREIHLFFSAVSRPATEDILDKCTQAGVYAFHPVISAYSEKDLLKKWETKAERWHNILLSACKQCEMPLLPVINEPVNFKDAVKQVSAAMPALICYEAEKKTQILNALKNVTAAKLAIFIGPEGGYSREEIALAQTANITPVSLGGNILRAQTAALAACWAALQ